MSALYKLDALRETYGNETELNLVVDKLVEVVLSQQRAKLEEYDRELREFETRYQMQSDEFYERFEAGELGDAADYFEWAGLYELRQGLAAKVQRLESAA